MVQQDKEQRQETVHKDYNFFNFWNACIASDGHQA